MNTSTSGTKSSRIYPTIAELLAQYPPPPPHEEWMFVDELQQPQSLQLRSERLVADISEANMQQGISIINRFPDPSGCLSTALEYLLQLANDNGKHRDSQEAYPVSIRQEASSCYEEYTLDVTPAGATLAANDCEGIRRGIYALSDMLLASPGPFIPCGKWKRKPWLKTRIGRCFFSPVKRWPVNTDELLDDIDYYPDEYLSRLAHEAINGLWLVVTLPELSETSFTPRDPLADRRMTKLHRVIKQCARYGIKVYLFCIEPYSQQEDAPLVQAHPELFGAHIGERRTFCPSSPATRQYLEELTYGVFKQAPKLGGLINITHGERLTTCLSSLQGTHNEAIQCPHCEKRKHGEVINDSLSAMATGLKKAAPAAQLIAWFYFPLTEKHAPWAHTIGAFVPSNSIAQFNFESGGEKTQLKRIHRGGDYWLSYVGPSSRFRRQALANRKAGVAVSAKLQVGCGYELGTVPFIPVPGVLYRKFEAMHKLGVEHAMFCWYVGNYPGLMNYTAGHLAFEEFKDSEISFLSKLAKPFWGAAFDSTAKAWELFTKAYEHLPFSLMFQYYGPQNTGLVWRMSVYPYLRPLSPPWKPIFPPSGDAIGEALAGFSLAEALMQMNKLNKGWQKGLQYLRKWQDLNGHDHERELDIGLAEALGIHFENTVNLLRFYQLRDKLFTATNRGESLPEMRKLAEREEKLSLEMVELCKKDSRLGFHSEALCHRYYPSLLKQRAEHLRTVVIPEIDELEEALNTGKTPWEQFLARPDAPLTIHPETWQTASTGAFVWCFLLEKDVFVLQIKKLAEMKETNDLVVYFMDASGITYPVKIRFTWHAEQITLQDENWRHVVGHPAPLAVSSQYQYSAKNTVTLKWPLAELPVAERRMRLNLCLGNSFAEGCGYEHRLYLNNFSPEQTVLLHW